MKTIISILLLAFAICSCEQEVTNINLPYKNKIVVQSIIEPDSLIQVNISHTLPPLENYDADKAKVLNAIVKITTDGKVYNLSSDTFGIYSNPELYGKSLKKYILDVEWNNLKAHSETIVPQGDQIDSIEHIVTFDDIFGDTTYIHSVYVYIKPTDKFCYLMDYSLNNDTLYSWNYSSDKPVRLFYDVSYTASKDVNPFLLSPITISCYDNQYTNYYSSRFDGASESDPFGISSSNVNWNVSGDALGLFIGRSKSYRTFFKK